jgi:small subunit ribosomal protein S14
MMNIGNTGDPFKTSIKRRNEIVDPNKPKYIYNEGMESLKWANWHTLKDLKKRYIVSEYYPTRVAVLQLYRYKCLPYELREHSLNIIKNEFPRKSQWRSGRLRYHCILTGRPRGRVMRFKVSRFMFRHLADYNKLSGVIKGKW